MIDALFITAGSRGGAFIAVVGAAGALTVVSNAVDLSIGTGGRSFAYSGGLGILDLYKFAIA